jgi:CubicO group peptidase (beta-lactamase class C family)
MAAHDSTRLAALAGSLPSLVAASDGAVSSYGYSDVERRTAASASTSYGIGSTTKTFVALTAMRLASDGLLDLHAPVSSILGDHPVLADATCHHLLSHTGGIPPLHARYAALAEGPVPDRSGGHDITPDWAGRLSSPGLDFVDAAGLLDYLSHFRIRRLAAPGRLFSYSNEGYAVLAGVIAKAAGTRFEQACEEAVLEPLGLASSAFLGSTRGARLADIAVPYVRNGAELTAARWWVAPAWHAPGGMLSSAGDLLTLAEAIRTRSVPGTRAGFVAAMCAPHAQRPGGGFYGYGVLGEPSSTGTLLGHTGARVGTSSALLWTENPHRTAAVLANVLEAPVVAAANLLLGVTPIATPPVEDLPREVLGLDRLVGTYWTAEGGSMTCTLTGSGLQAAFLGRTVGLTATSTTRFVSVETGVKVEFLVDGSQPAWGLSFGDRILTRRKAVTPWPLGRSRA